MIYDRAIQKQLSREKDLADLAAGRITPEELRKQNGFATCLPLKDFKIVAIGGKPVRKDKKRR